MSTTTKRMKHLVLALMFCGLTGWACAEMICDEFEDGKLWNGIPIQWESETCLPGTFEVEPGILRFWRLQLGQFGYLHTSQTFNGDMWIQVRGKLAGAQGFGVVVHADRCNNAYIGGVNNTQGQMHMGIMCYEAGVGRVLGARPLDNIFPNEEIIIRLDVDESKLALRVWRSGDDMPEEALEVVDVTHRTGFAGVYCSTASVDGTTWTEIHSICIPGHEDPPPEFRRCDANADGEIDISDAVFILDYLFTGGTEPTCLDSADCDDNGALEVTDAISLLNFLFLGGPAPEQPFPACGPDPTTIDEDPELTCESFLPCQQ